MLDFQTARQNMVDCQVRTNDVTNHALLDALSTVPRERFVPQEKSELAYIDEDISLGGGRYLMEPAPLAKLIQAAGVSGDDVVLDVGCGSGYSTAVLSRLASLVIAIEEDADLVELATGTLSDLDYDNTIVVKGVLNEGYPSEGPYDVVFLGGAVEEIPTGLFSQLRDGGKLLAVEGHGNAGVARLYMRNGDDVSGRSLFNCAIQPLPGFDKKPEFVL